MTIKIYLTGRVTVEVNGKAIIDEHQFRGKQGRLAFSYLVCERTRPVPRGELAILLWPDEMPLLWSGALSAVISRFRRILNSDSLKAQGISLSQSLGKYQLELSRDVWIDVETGISAIDRAEAALRNGEPSAVLGPATVAASIARRPFLSGVSGEWADSQRRKLERQLVRALDCLSQMWIAMGEPGLAIETAIEATVLDPFRESSHRVLMYAYSESGNRAEAVNTYHRLRRLLDVELGTAPSVETEAVYLEMLR